MKRFKVYHQKNIMDCGPMCLHMVAKHYGKNIGLEKLRNDAGLSKQGVSLLGLSEAAERIGIKTHRVAISYEQLKNEAPLPAILHWNQNHFVVVTPKANKKTITVADPAKGIISYTKEEFCQHKKSIQYKTGLSAQAEIITADLRLTERFLNSLRKNVSR